jgi:hypothetical protein
MGVTSEGAAALWIRCQGRVIDLTRDDFAAAIQVVDEIEASSPVSRHLICRRFIRSQFATQLRYEVDRYPRDLARSAIHLKQRLAELHNVKSTGSLEDCALVVNTPSALLPAPVFCTVSKPGCFALTVTVPQSALAMVHTSPEARARFASLLDWEVCASPLPLLNSPIS